MANWSNPLLTSTYTNFLTEVKDRDTDLALQFDGTTSSNIPTGAIRWNSSVNRWQKWNGSTWGELTSTYALTGLTTTGNASIGGTLGSGAFTSTGSVSGTALLPTGNTVPTNGIYLPSANVFGIATSSTARLIIDASGNLGIGTLSPATGLHVGNAAASATSGNLYIAPTAAAGQARIRLYNGGAQAEWLLGQKTSSDHAFKLSKLVSGSESDYFTVDTVGNLSLPATGMRLRLGRILDADANDSTLTLFGGTNDGANIELYGGAHATLANLAVIDANEHRFRTANGVTERVRIDSSGRLLVGTSSDSGGALLQVNGATSFSVSSNWNFPGLLLRRTASNVATAKQISFLLDGDTESDTTLTNYLNIWGTYSGTPTTSSTSTALSASMNLGAPNAFIAHTNGSERARITSAGRFGLGTSSPGYLLHVNTASNVDVETATQNSTGLSRFGSRTGGNAFIGAFTASKGVEIWAASAQVAYFADTGRFGLGTSSPGTSFDVALPAASATVGNVRVSPSSVGQARYHLYNGGATAEWLFGQKTSTDHDFKLSTSVAGSETDRLTVTTGGLLKFDSGYGSAATAYGCRAWVNFDGTGTSATNQTIRGNGNVSSVYKSGTGNYLVTFTTAMPDANYAVNVTVRQAGSGSNIKATVDNIQSDSCRVYCNDPATAGLLDSSAVCVTIFR